MLSKNMPVLSEVLPSQTLDTVSLCGIPYPTRNRDAKATAAKIVFTTVCNKVTVLEPFSDLRQTDKVRSIEQPVAFGKCVS